MLDCIHLLKHINNVLVNFIFKSVNTKEYELVKITYSMSDIRYKGMVCNSAKITYSMSDIRDGM